MEAGTAPIKGAQWLTRVKHEALFCEPENRLRLPEKKEQPMKTKSRQKSTMLTLNKKKENETTQQIVGGGKELLQLVRNKNIFEGERVYKKRS